MQTQPYHNELVNAVSDDGFGQSDVDGQADLRARTQEILEFHLIRERVAERALFFPARQLARQLTPAWDAREVAELQQETAEGRAVMDNGGDVDMRSEADIDESVARAVLGGILTGMELLAIAAALDVHHRARSGILSVRQHAPLLADVAEGIPDLRELARQIRARIGSRGEVRDDATRTLRALRSQIRQAYQRVTASLNTLIQSSQADNALQDNVISIRNDRLVVQVKAEMRSRIPGIVHDASNTGATLFIEPFSTVEMGNTWRELALAEEREIRQVLRDISTLVGELAYDIRRANDLTARLDLIMARARYSYAIRGTPAASRGNADVDADMCVRLINARHPLLGRDAVPVNVSVGPGWSVLIVTGPNTGGKTVAMKTVGLLALMRQAGLQIPADEGSTLPVFDGVYADVGDQQSIEQSVSTFSSHIRNVIRILAAATPNSLVLLDELGTSTDAEEGSALAKAILDHLAGGGVSTIATTHHRSVAAFAETSPCMMNASVQLDPNSLAPTYHLTLGIPGRSYAMAIAASLGLPTDIMRNAESLMEPQHLRFEDWLTELQRERSQLQATLMDAERTRADAEAQRRKLDEQIDYLIVNREDILSGVRRQALAQYDEAQRRLKRAEAALSWSAGVGAPTTTTKADIARIRREISAQRAEAAAANASSTAALHTPPRALAVGDSAYVRGLNLSGTIVSLPQDGGGAEVGIGSIRIQVQQSRLSLIESRESRPDQPEAKVSIEVGPMLDSGELDIRGMRAEESVAQLEQFLDKAVRDGFSSVRIIHGKGKGVLRNAVREHLNRHPLARSFEAEARERGGDGATLVQLA